MHYSFKEDLSDAKVTEREFIDCVKNRVTVHKVETCDDKSYDAKIWYSTNTVPNSMRVLTFEIKHDIMHAKTGNIGIEFECRGKPSGISTTEADYWVTRIESGFYLIKTELLKHLINECLYYKVGIGGDDGTAFLFLFKENTIIPKMHKL